LQQDEIEVEIVLLEKYLSSDEPPVKSILTKLLVQDEI
jgi:hypothetical protein